jgi:hypothetical protein
MWQMDERSCGSVKPDTNTKRNGKPPVAVAVQKKGPDVLLHSYLLYKAATNR